MKPIASWTMAKVIIFGVLLIILAVNNSLAAPAISNEDQVGFVPSQQAYRSRESLPFVPPYNLVIPDPGMPESPMGTQQQQPLDFAILNYLLARHASNNRFRSFPELDSARNELNRKRSSYSKYCAFNAVSCFGRKK